MKKRDKQFLIAAVAGISMGIASAACVAEDAKAEDVKCWGVNGCGHSAKCSVSAEDLAAFKALLGDKEFDTRFGRSEAHACGSHAKCGASAHILNWVPMSQDQCKVHHGYVVEESGTPKRKVARKA
jgi:hypothetical protein